MKQTIVARYASRLASATTQRDGLLRHISREEANIRARHDIERNALIPMEAAARSDADAKFSHAAQNALKERGRIEAEAQTAMQRELAQEAANLADDEKLRRELLGIQWEVSKAESALGPLAHLTFLAYCKAILGF